MRQRSTRNAHRAQGYRTCDNAAARVLTLAAPTSSRNVRRSPSHQKGIGLTFEKFPSANTFSVPEIAHTALNRALAMPAAPLVLPALPVLAPTPPAATAAADDDAAASDGDTDVVVVESQHLSP